MFVCWKKVCYAALTAKTFANFAPFLDPKMGVEKWTQKWRQNLASKMVSKNGTQKWHLKGCHMFWLEKDLQEIKYWAPFGCHFETPFWRSNSGTIFGSIFQPPVWSPKMVQNLQKFLLSKLHNKLFSSKQTCTSKCICSDFLASCISEHNVILLLVKPSKIEQVLIPTNVAHKQDGLEPQNLILWRSFHARPIFYMKNDPVLGSRQNWYFVKMHLVRTMVMQKRISSLALTVLKLKRKNKVNLCAKTISFWYPHKFEKQL